MTQRGFRGRKKRSLTLHLGNLREEYKIPRINLKPVILNFDEIEQRRGLLPKFNEDGTLTVNDGQCVVYYIDIENSRYSTKKIDPDKIEKKLNEIQNNMWGRKLHFTHCSTLKGMETQERDFRYISIPVFEVLFDKHSRLAFDNIVPVLIPKLWSSFWMNKFIRRYTKIWLCKWCCDSFNQQHFALDNNLKINEKSPLSTIELFFNQQN